jgi:hypothetical protein
MTQCHWVNAYIYIMGVETPITDRTGSTAATPPPPERIGREGLSYILAGLRYGPR